MFDDFDLSETCEEYYNEEVEEIEEPDDNWYYYDAFQSE